MLPINFFPQWTTLRGFGNSSPAKLTILIPLIGYLIIFNDQVTKFLQISSELVGVGPSPGISTRLLCVYFGLCLIALGTTIYSLLCPREIKYYGSSAAYVRGDGPSLGDFAMEEIEDDLRESQYKDRYLVIRGRYEGSGGHPKIPTDAQKQQIDNGILHLYFEKINNSWAVLRLLTLGLFASGTVCLLVPSLEIFFRITSILVRSVFD